MEARREALTRFKRAELLRIAAGGVFGINEPAVIARGQDYRDVFQVFRPGFDLEAERQARLDAGLGEYLNAGDLYPDARPCLQALKERHSHPHS